MCCMGGGGGDGCDGCGGGEGCNECWKSFTDLAKSPGSKLIALLASSLFMSMFQVTVELPVYPTGSGSCAAGGTEIAWAVMMAIMLSSWAWAVLATIILKCKSDKDDLKKWYNSAWIWGALFVQALFRIIVFILNMASGSNSQSSATNNPLVCPTNVQNPANSGTIFVPANWFVDFGPTGAIYQRGLDVAVFFGIIFFAIVIAYNFSMYMCGGFKEDSEKASDKKFTFIIRRADLAQFLFMVAFLFQYPTFYSAVFSETGYQGAMNETFGGGVGMLVLAGFTVFGENMVEVVEDDDYIGV